MTTAELLEELDERVAVLRVRMAALAAAHVNGTGGVPTPANGESMTAEAFRIRLGLAGLTKAEFATVFALPPAVVLDWLSGGHPIPCWVLPALHLIELLPPAMRRSVLKTPAPKATRRTTNPHPFSRIEEL